MTFGKRIENISPHWEMNFCRQRASSRVPLPAMSSPSPSEKHPDPLHGVTLETIVTQLVAWHGWETMGDRIPIRCFILNPSVKSSLTFLRKTPWARKKVESWYVEEIEDRRSAAE